MPTIVGIFSFIGMINTTSERLKVSGIAFLRLLRPGFMKKIASFLMWIHCFYLYLLFTIHYMKVNLQHLGIIILNISRVSCLKHDEVKFETVISHFDLDSQ